MKILILDVDGVILDYIPALLACAMSIGIEIKKPYSEIKGGNLQQFFADDVSANLVIEQFNESDDFASIPLMEGFIEVMAEIKAYAPGLRVECLTSCGTSPKIMKNRIKNLQGLGIDEIHFLPLGESKFDILAKYDPHTVFVDDMVETVRNSPLCCSILFTQPHNEGRESEVNRASWSQPYRFNRMLTVDWSATNRAGGTLAERKFTERMNTLAALAA